MDGCQERCGILVAFGIGNEIVPYPVTQSHYPMYPPPILQDFN
jgi:hypothetical protein